MTSYNSILSNPYLAIAVAIIVIILVIFAWFRAGTIISLLERLWTLIVGKADVNDPILLKFNKDIRDIEQFNFVYGLKLTSIEQMHKVIRLVELRKLSFVDVRSARKWIDMQNMNIQLPTKSYINWKIISFVLCAVLLILSSTALGAKSVLLQFKTSKTWFFLDQHKAQGFSVNWVLESEQCDSLEKKEASIPALKENEKQIICESFKDKSFAEYLAKTLRSQRIFSGFMFCALLMWILVISKQVQSYRDAKKIKDILGTFETKDILN